MNPSGSKKPSGAVMPGMAVTLNPPCCCIATFARDACAIAMVCIVESAEEGCSREPSARHTATQEEIRPHPHGTSQNLPSRPPPRLWVLCRERCFFLHLLRTHAA